MAICTNACPDVPGACEDEPSAPPGFTCVGVAETAATMTWDIVLTSGGADSYGAVADVLSFDFLTIEGGQLNFTSEICNPTGAPKILRFTGLVSHDGLSALKTVYISLIDPATGVVYSATGPVGAVANVPVTFDVPMPAQATTTVALRFLQPVDLSFAPENFRGSLTVSVV